MFDSAVAFDRYRLEVVRSWPASEAKDKLMAPIECTLRESERPDQPQPVGRDDFGAGAGDDNLQKIIEDLHREKEKLDRIIASFEELLGAKTMATFQKKRRGRKSMSTEERLKVSTRMNRYWQARRATGTGINAPAAASSIVRA